MTSTEDSLAPVLRDVLSTTDVQLRLEFLGEDRAVVRVVTQDASATTLHLQLAGTESERIATAAEQIQEVIIEEQWARASNWPMCPAHRSTHPLEVAVAAGEAWWSCPLDHAKVAQVGALKL